ncbi:MAG: hypothetical protein ACT4O3_05280 [Elusimicrobiota bacterium]
MTTEQLKKLRQYFHSLTELNVIFVTHDNLNIDGTPVDILTEELSRLNGDFPSLFPPFDPNRFFSHAHGDGQYYKVSGIRSFLATILGRLKVLTESVEETPVTESRQFTFIKNPELRNIIERDYSELQRAFISKCHKASIILAGGAIETILTDLLSSNEAKARLSPKAPKKPDIVSWDLKDLIEVAIDLKLIHEGINKLSHSIREYRNLVHPGNEIKNKLSFNEEEAKIAIEVLHMLHRHLST